MMWLRNLLFLGLVGGGVVALGASLMPPREPRPVTRYDAGIYQTDEFRAVVERVDASFRAFWGEFKVQPTSPASDLAIARRLSLGLMGTIPSLEEIRQLEWLPPDQRLAWWIDHVLQDRRFADYQAERLARAAVGVEDGPFILFRRRRLVAWLGDQVSRGRPHDQLVRDLIASEGLWTDRPATNFVSVTSRPEKKNQPDPIRLAGRVTRAFLGLRLDCAECHNHPYARWKQADFQGLAAFFGQTHIGFTGVYDGEGEFEVEDRRKKDDLAMPSTSEEGTVDESPPPRRVVIARVPFAEGLLPPEGTRRQRLAAWVTHPKNPYFARATVNRVWALMVGRPLNDPVDNLEAEVPVPAALQILADDFAANGFDVRRLIRIIASTQAYRLDSASDRDPTEDDEKAWASFPLTRLRPEQVVGSVIQASSATTIDAESHIVVRTIRLANINDFVKRYGDSGEDDFGGRGGTIPQRLLMMNGELVRDRIKDSPFNASTRIANLSLDDTRTIETAYLTVLTRRPTPEETEYFEQVLADRSVSKPARLEDLYWALINSTEFSWNH